MLNQDQLKANIDAMQSQGASHDDIQGYLDSLKTSNNQASDQRTTLPKPADNAPKVNPFYNAMGKIGSYIGNKTAEGFSNTGKLLTGVGKGAVGTMKSLGQQGETMFQAPLKATGLIPKETPTGTSQVMPSDESLKATNPWEKAGKVAEFAGEMAIPIGAEEKTAGLVGKGANVLEDLQKANAIKKADSLTSAITQGQKYAIPALKKGLEEIDTTGIKTYDDLVSHATGTIKGLAQKVDSKLAENPTLNSLKSFSVKVGSKTINYVKDALDHLAELANSTSDKELIPKVEQWTNQAVTKGLSALDVNNIAKEYGMTFGEKAFDKSGLPRTSVNAQLFENVRTGVKDAARALMPDETTKTLDKAMSNVYKVKTAATKMVEKVNDVSQKIEQNPGLLKKAAGILGTTVDTLSGGTIKTFLNKVLGKAIGGSGSLSALEIEKTLSKNLNVLGRATGETSSGVVKALKYFHNIFTGGL